MARIKLPLNRFLHSRWFSFRGAGLQRPPPKTFLHTRKSGTAALVALLGLICVLLFSYSPREAATISHQSCEFDHIRDWDDIQVPACAQNGEADSFIMAFFGESGSTAILSTIMEHSRVFKRNQSTVPEMGEMELLESVPPRDKLRTMNTYFKDAARAGQIPGFKFRPANLWYVKKLYPKHKPRILWNYRRNSFQKAVGEIRKSLQRKPPGGLTEQSWEVYCKENSVCTYKLEIDRVIKQIRAGNTVEKEVSRVMRKIDSDCILPVAYEELDECPERLFAQIYKFLGLKYEHHQSPYKKFSGQELCDEVENWDEICNAFMPCTVLRWQIDPHFKCKCNHLRSDVLASNPCPLDWNEELSNRTVPQTSFPASSPKVV